MLGSISRLVQFGSITRSDVACHGQFNHGLCCLLMPALVDVDLLANVEDLLVVHRMFKGQDNSVERGRRAD